MTTKKESKLPEFKDALEEAEFWAGASEEFADELEELDEEVRLSPSEAARIKARARKRLMSVRVQEEKLSRLKKIAEETGKPYQVLARDAIETFVDGHRFARMLRPPAGLGDGGDPKDPIRIMRVPRSRGYLYTLLPPDRARLQKRLAGAGVLVPQSTFCTYDTFAEFLNAGGVPFDQQAPACFHISRALGLVCVVVDAASGRILWKESA